MLLFLAFAIVAVILAASGIYGVMSNTVSQRTQEIGVKRALGANESMITKDYLLTGFKQLLWGAIPGLLAGCTVGFALSKMMSTGVVALVFIALTMLTIIGVTLMLATYFPTRRALKMEPAEALHYE